MFRSHVLEYETRHGRSLDVRRFVNFILMGGQTYHDVLKLVIHELPPELIPLVEPYLEIQLSQKRICLNVEMAGSGKLFDPVCGNPEEELQSVMNMNFLFEIHQNNQNIPLTTQLKDISQDSNLVVTRITEYNMARRMGLEDEDFTLDNQNHVVEIQAQYHELNLHGLTDFPNLYSLKLQNIQNTTSLPVGALQNLTTLKFEYIENTESMIPTEIGLLTKLQILSLVSSYHGGYIPTQIGNLIELNSLDLQENSLHGRIPTQLGNLTKCKVLVLRNNDLTGPIPTEIGLMRSLITASLESNQLTGNIPSELQHIPRLYSFNCTNNNLSGIVPSVLRSRIQPHYFERGNNLRYDMG